VFRPDIQISSWSGPENLSGKTNHLTIGFATPANLLVQKITSKTIQ